MFRSVDCGRAGRAGPARRWQIPSDSQCQYVRMYVYGTLWVLLIEECRVDELDGNEKSLFGMAAAREFHPLNQHAAPDPIDLITCGNPYELCRKSVWCPGTWIDRLLNMENRPAGTTDLELRFWLSGQLVWGEFQRVCVASLLGFRSYGDRFVADDPNRRLSW